MPVSANLFESLFARAPRLDKIALDSPDGHSLTYGELYARAGRAARALVDLGVEPGDRVAAQIDKSPDAIVLALACFRAGAALLPLNTAYTLPELEYFLADARPALTLCRPASLEAVRALGAKLALPAVESLGSPPRRGGGRGGAGAPPAGRARARRSRGHSLHFRHDGPLEGRDAHPRESLLERTDAGG